MVSVTAVLLASAQCNHLSDSAAVVAGGGGSREEEHAAVAALAAMQLDETTRVLCAGRQRGKRVPQRVREMLALAMAIATKGV